MENIIIKALIKEAITQRISEIDKAGDEAAENAKLSKIEQDAKKVSTLKSMLSKEVFTKYIDAKALTSVIKDLESIGFVDIKTEVRESYSDSGHPQWIYVKAYKP